MEHDQKHNTGHEYEKRHKKVAVSDDGLGGTDKTHSISFSMRT